MTTVQATPTLTLPTRGEGISGVSRQALSTVLNGHASLSADMALRFERHFKISADMLMRLQTSYDLAQARMQLAG